MRVILFRALICFVHFNLLTYFLISVGVCQLSYYANFLSYETHIFEPNNIYKFILELFETKDLISE